jgi:hypothetical protein
MNRCETGEFLTTKIFSSFFHYQISLNTTMTTTTSECVATTLLLVDVQNDFHPGGSLAIPTAGEDSQRVAQLIRQHSSKISRVVATMDSHVKLHIAHPGFWVSGKDDTQHHPDPFTVIQSKDIEEGVWKPRRDLKIRPGTIEEDVFGTLTDFTNSDGTLDLYRYAIEYTKRLEERGTLVEVVLSCVSSILTITKGSHTYLFHHDCREIHIDHLARTLLDRFPRILYGG